MVKSMKKLIATSWNKRSLNEDALCRALLQYRNTPSRKDGLSPAQKLFGTPVQDSLPAHHRSFLPCWQKAVTEAETQATNSLEQTQAYYNLHAHTLPDIGIGSRVALQHPQTKMWDIYGTVVDIGPHRRYFIKTQNGRILTRNRLFLRRRTATSLLPSTTPAPPEQPQQTFPQQSTSAEVCSSPRHSTRTHQAPKRLIEDPNWP